MTIGELIRQRRKEANLTVENLGDICGVPKSTVSRWENGRIKKIPRDVQEKLCITLRIDPVLFFNTDEVLFRDERELLKAYREADERARQDALKMLLEHKKVKKEGKMAI